MLCDVWTCECPRAGTGAVKITPAHDPNDFECGAPMYVVRKLFVVCVCVVMCVCICVVCVEGVSEMYRCPSQVAADQHLRRRRLHQPQRHISVLISAYISLLCTYHTRKCPGLTHTHTGGKFAGQKRFHVRAKLVRACVCVCVCVCVCE